MKSLFEHAKDELEMIGMFTRGPAGFMDGQIGEAIMELMTTFERQGHNDVTAGLLARILPKLMAREPLTPLTDDPDEWEYIGIEHEGLISWRSKRDPVAISRDKGKTFFDSRLPANQRVLAKSKRKVVNINANN